MTRDHYQTGPLPGPFGWVPSVAVILVIAFATQFVAFLGFLAPIEGLVADLYLRSGVPSADTPAIVTLAIDEADYRTFFAATSPLFRPGLLNLIDTILSSARPAVIGVDVLTDSAGYQTSPEKAALLAKARERMVPIVWAASGDPAAPREPVGFWSWLWGREHDEPRMVAGPVLGEPRTCPDQAIPWGIPLFPRDEDRKIRRFARRVAIVTAQNNAGEPMQCSSWAKTVVQAYCVNRPCRELGDAPEVSLRYDARSDAAAREEQHVSIGSLFKCDDPDSDNATDGAGRAPCSRWSPREDAKATLASRLDRAIVLLGGTYGSSFGTMTTSHADSARTISALTLNVAAIKAETQGLAAFRQAHHQPWPLWLDIGVGIVMTFVFHYFPPRRFIGAIAYTVITAAVLAGVTVALLAFRFLWITWVGVLAFGNTWHLLYESFASRKR